MRRAAILTVLTVVAVVVPVTSEIAAADATVAAPFFVNFQAQTTTTPSGYVGDYGQAYDATRGYGWVDTSGAPLSLVGNGRERTAASDKRLDTLVHMQLPPGSSGVSTQGAWRASVPNGTYSVTVAVGDPSYIDSHHVIHVEGVTAIDFTPTSAQTSQTNTVNVTVVDGFVDVDANGGTNTKLDYLQIQPATASAPHVTAVQPANGATSVFLDTAVTVQLSDGVDPSTANGNGLRVIGPGNAVVSGFYNTDGPYSNITFVPTVNLAPNSSYTVQVTSALTDPAGDPYQPFSSTFATGSSTAQQPSPVSFSKATFDVGDGTNGTANTAGPTAIAIGPDNRLYVAFGTGDILAYPLDANGRKAGPPTDITAFKFQRTIAGIRFDPASTSTNLTLWVSNGQFGCDLGATGVACNDFTGMISKLSGSSPSTLTRTDVVTGLPRSVGNHMNNGIDFGPDGAMYLGQGANSGYGAPDAIWGNRSEDPLSAAILRIDYKSITATPYSVDTSKGYDPTASGAKVTVYASGTRNPFSVLWHSNGKLYAPVNESANGNTPADPAGGAPALTNLPAFDDYFTQILAGRYYGHPNPARNQYRLNGANPTSGVDPFEVGQYPVGTTPNANWQKPDMDLGLHRSPDGSVEFRSNVFGGTLRGQVLVTEYSQGKDIIAIQLDSSGKPVSRTSVMGGFNNPLPITADPVSGRVYVGEYGRDPDGAGGAIDVLTPVVTSQTVVAKINFQAQSTVTPTGYAADYGQAFDTTRGYGWESLTGGALSIVGNGRERNLVSDKRLDTFIHMQLPAGSTGVSTPARWEMAVPNGSYTVTIAVGDPGYYDSHNVVNVEGNKVVDFTPTSGSRQTTVTAPVTVNDGRLTVDPSGGTNTKIDYLDVATGTATTDTTAPTVTASASGTRDASGNYVGGATVSVTAVDDVGGSGVASTQYSVDGGAYQAYTAPFTVSAVGSHTVVAKATDAAGNTGTSAPLSFTVVAGATSPITITSPDDRLGVGTRLVFSTVAKEVRPGKRVTLKNNGTSAVSVTGLTITGADAGEFAIDAAQAKTFSIAAGGTASVLVDFVPVDAKVVDTNAVLNIATNVSGSPTLTVPLAGLNAIGYEGTNEPSVQEIINVLGYSGTNAGVTNAVERNYISDQRTPVGDEIISPYWKRADSSAPIQLFPVAHYSSRGNYTSGPIAWYAAGSPGTLNNLFSIPGGTDVSGGQNQRLLPTLTAGSITSFATSGAFGIHDEFGDFSDDALATSGLNLHDLRFYPAKRADGTQVANAWLVADDVGQDPSPTSGKNWDYQDYVFLLVNAQPAVAAAARPGDATLALDFSSARVGTIADKAGLGTGFTSVQANSGGTQYLPGNLSLDTSTGRLRVVTTAGTNTNTTNTQQNALQLSFDASRSRFQVQSRFTGPFTAINLGSDQQAIYVGPDQDNYFKVEVECQNDGRQHLTIWFESGGAGQILTTTVLTTPSAATLDLFVIGDPNAGTLQAAYRIASDSSSAIVTFGSAVKVPNVTTWFSPSSRAGIMANNSSGGSPFTAIFDSFSVIGA
jgi:hypothetical protein